MIVSGVRTKRGFECGLGEMEVWFGSLNTQNIQDEKKRNLLSRYETVNRFEKEMAKRDRTRKAAQKTRSQ